MSNEILKTLVQLEGHCCIRCYLLTCAKEGQSQKDMAAHMGVAESTIRYNYERMRAGKKSHRCPKQPHVVKTPLP